MQISQKAFDMCVAEEVSSKAYYIRHYQRPEWPGLSSGVTVGIGYDLGQCSRAKIQNDWKALVDANMLLVMMSCAGHTGNAGKVKLAEVKNSILIPWDAALKVFAERDVPSWTAAVIRAVPGADKLPPTCLGVLFDTAYNRGNSWGMQGDRYREMRGIKNHVMTKALGLVPSEYESMKRLWPNTVGLRRRCDHRITLWREGMNEKVVQPLAPVGPTPAVPNPEVPLNEGPARTKPPVTSTAQNTTTGTIVAGGVGGAVVAAKKDLISMELAIFIGFLALLGAVTGWIFWYRNRNPG